MKAKRILAIATFNLVAVLLIVALASLAEWQIQRRAWKLDLISRVEARSHADAVAAPTRERWASVSVSDDEYRRVSVSGQWLDIHAALVRAVTVLGEGYWVMSPFARNDGTTVLINRGFVPAEISAPNSWTPQQPFATVTGKLRLSEPSGAFLRTNDLALDRWFSRDVAAIAQSRGVSNCAPYFIDAELPSAQNNFPIPSLTVLSFTNNHLVYALTWAALALMTAVGTIFIDLEFVGSRQLRSRVR